MCVEVCDIVCVSTCLTGIPVNLSRVAWQQHQCLANDLILCPALTLTLQLLYSNFHTTSFVHGQDKLSCPPAIKSAFLGVADVSYMYLTVNKIWMWTVFLILPTPLFRTDFRFKRQNVLKFSPKYHARACQKTQSSYKDIALLHFTRLQKMCRLLSATPFSAAYNINTQFKFQCITNHQIKSNLQTVLNVIALQKELCLASSMYNYQTIPTQCFSRQHAKDAIPTALMCDITQEQVCNVTSQILERIIQFGSLCHMKVG